MDLLGSFMPLPAITPNLFSLQINSRPNRLLLSIIGSHDVFREEIVRVILSISTGSSSLGLSLVKNKVRILNRNPSHYWPFAESRPPHIRSNKLICLRSNACRRSGRFKCIGRVCIIKNHSGHLLVQFLCMRQVHSPIVAAN